MPTTRIDMTPQLKCILCANHPQAPGLESVAVYVVNGLSVCKEHSVIAKNAKDFHDAWHQLMEDYVRKAA